MLETDIFVELGLPLKFSIVSLPHEKSYYVWGIADFTSHEGFEGMVSFPREKSYYEWGIADFTSHEGFEV